MAGWKATLVFCATGAVMAGSAMANDLGLETFLQSCAPCHGTDGAGGGPLAGNLSGPLPDLTTLTARNNGAFPAEAVVATLDGTGTVDAHGSREMPVWGTQFSLSRDDIAETDLSAEEGEELTRLRIEALTDYLETLQRD